MPRFILLCLAVFTLHPLFAANLPYGAQVEVRLLHRVGSRTTQVGDMVEAAVITPVLDKESVLVPTGSIVTGPVDRVDRLGLGLRHVVARLDLRFTRLRMPDGTTIPIDARVAAVETARESVRTSGAIIGINPTANFSTGVSTVFTLFYLGEPEVRLPLLGFKFLAARSPDAEIDFPAGTEMVIRLAGNVELTPTANRQASVPLLPATEIASVQNIVNRLPAQQTDQGRNHSRPSDLVNILITGNEGAITRSFHAAGWSAPESHGVLALYHMFHCAVERKTSGRMAMSNLKFNGVNPDIAFEKGLDTFAKRHHVRLWHDERSGAWLGAATEDVSYRVHRAKLTHATDPSIDNERAKIVNDLAFTGCVDKGALIPRASLKPAEDAGSSIFTDGDIAVIHLDSCESPRFTPPDPHKAVPVRIVRAVVAVGTDIARSNPVSVAISITKSLLDHSKTQANLQLQAARTFTRSSAIASVSTASANGALAAR